MDKTNAIEIRNMSKSFKIQHDGTKSIKDFVLRFGGSKAERHEVLKNINLKGRYCSSDWCKRQWKVHTFKADD